MSIGASSPFDLNGSVAYVTGGLGQIGRAISRGLLEAGASVVILEPPEVVVSMLADFPVDLVEPFSATDTGSFSTRLRKIWSKRGRPDIWVNAAYPRSQGWRHHSQANMNAGEWRENVDLQLNATCLLSAAVAAEMALSGGGSLINIASIYGVVGPDFSIYEGLDMTMPPAYAAIKGGLIAYTRYLATYFGEKQVRANVICPGGVENNQPPSFVKKYQDRTPLGRMARAEEIAGPVVFLASDAASYVTGSVLMVDGGWTAR